MDKLRELVDKFCPDGVKYEPLSNKKFFKFYYGKGNNIPEDIGGKYDVYGANGVVSHINEYNCEDVSIIGHIGAVGMVNRCKGKCFVTYNGTIAEVVDKSKVDSQYLYYVLTNLNLPSYKKGSQPFLSVSDFDKIRIPIPPLEVQCEIVKILDKFEEHISCLKRELTLREESCESIMHQLLKKENFKNFDTLENYCSFEKGKTPIQKNKPGCYPLVATTEFLQTSDNYQFDCEAVCLPLISARGHGVASITRIFYQSGKFALGNILCAIIPKDNQIKAEFLRNYLFYYKDILLVPLMRGGANVALTIDSLKKVQIPIPSIDEQQNIIEKIRPFQDIISKDKGLPAEIEKRQMQYEYYKDKLLRFKEVEVNE